MFNIVRRPVRDPECFVLSRLVGRSRGPGDGLAGIVYESLTDEDAFSCPLLPMSIRSKLMYIAEELQNLNYALLNRAFERGVGGG